MVNDQQSSLRLSEWILVGSFLLLFASSALIAKVNASQAPPLIKALPAIEEKISISIEGAVRKPGTYLVRPATPLRKVLAKAKPKPFANLRSFDLDQPVETSLTLHIEELAEISVSIAGAVEAPVTLLLPPGTRIADLKAKLSLAPDADRSFFKKRRLLKDGEAIAIPKKIGHEHE